MKTIKFTIVLFIASTLFSCVKDLQEEQSFVSKKTPITRSENAEYFNWDTADYMPYPTNIIPVPWIGQGSLASDYDLDVVNDHKNADGWELVYSTFKSSVATNNPYFILYNKYRGLMRLYIYVTNQSMMYSTNTHNTININSNYNTSMLNYLGTSLVDGSSRHNNYDEINQNPTGGNLYAPNKWYMTQYEFAYDPYIANQAYNSITLNFHMMYVNSQNIIINGSQTGTINGTISSAGGNFMASLQGATNSAISGSFGFLGKNALDHYKDNTSPNGNKLGINSNLWSGLVSGATSLISGGVTGTLQNAANILSGIVFGNGGSEQTVNLQFDSSITMSGSITESGLFPSMPISVYMPGTNIPSNAQGQIPNYNYPLGVFNVIEEPNVYLDQTAKHYRYWGDYGWETETITTLELGQNHDFSAYVKVNPAVLSCATVDISYDIIGKTDEYGYEIDPSYYAYESDITGSQNTAIPNVEMMIRYRVKVTPFDTNVSPSVIYKTFKLNPVIHYTNLYYGYDRNTNIEKEKLMEKVKAQENRKNK